MRAGVSVDSPWAKRHMLGHPSVMSIADRVEFIPARDVVAASAGGILFIQSQEAVRLHGIFRGVAGLWLAAGSIAADTVMSAMAIRTNLKVFMVWLPFVLTAKAV
jgi:hypothetical protein